MASLAVANSCARLQSSLLLASVGVLSDIQCAPTLENGHNYTRTETRYYKHALVAAERAVQQLTRTDLPGRPPVQAVLHFGDLIDGFNAQHGTSESALAAAMRALPAPATTRIIQSITPGASDKDARLELATYHLIGNHELMNFPRGRWANELNMGALAQQSILEAAARPPIKKTDASYRFTTNDHPGNGIMQLVRAVGTKVKAAVSGSSAAAASAAPALVAPFTSAAPLYYDILVADRYRLLMLDAYEVSVTGYSDVMPNRAHSQAYDFLERENPNANKLSPLNMKGIEQRKVGFNGGISQRQIEWIRSCLDECERRGQYAILCSHDAFHPSAACATALLWNQDEILSLVHEYRARILACLHGHDHDGGHFVDEDGVTHHTFQAILTAPDDEDAYGRLDFYQDHVEFRGTGMVTSFALEVPSRPQPPQPKAPTAAAHL